MTNRYFTIPGGHPPQTDLLTGRAVFTEAYAVIPKGVMKDIVTSCFPFWEKTRGWILARPLSGFAETFSQYVMEVEAGGGSDRPETDPRAQAALFVVDGEIVVTMEGQARYLTSGGFAYIPAGMAWTLRNFGKSPARFHWIRKAYDAVEGLGTPEPVIANENDIKPNVMPGTDGRWATTSSPSSPVL